jgi:hypothetical protein
LQVFAEDVDGSGGFSAHWSQIAGTPATILAPEATYTGVELPEVAASEDLLFEVVVTDAVGQQSRAEVTIRVVDRGPPPDVSAGEDQEVDEGQLVQLSGSASVYGGSIYRVAWEQVSGPAVTLSFTGSSRPTFTAPLVHGDRELVFRFTAETALGNTASDTVRVLVRDLDPLDTTPPEVSHQITSRKDKGKTYYQFSLSANEPAELYFRHSEALWPQGGLMPSEEYPGWYRYSGSEEFLGVSGARYIEYFGRDLTGNESEIRSTGAL